MKIYLGDPNSAENCTLEISRGKSGACFVTLEIAHRTSRQVKRSAEVSPSKLLDLAAFIGDFWAECPPCEISELGLALVYSHREHIGEGYYYVAIDGVNQVLVYEQLGTSNAFTAGKIRDAISAATR